ncbi:MAG: hypothetical protein H7A05_01825 [Pseudomonadales bacterium]|nr:hypothetical protein [Pseudomonadales bacterium]
MQPLEAVCRTSKANFEDYNQIPDPQVFSGQAKYVGISYALIGVAYQASAIQLGGARYIGHGHQVGYDASIYAGVGISTVTNVSKLNCGCE